MVIWGLLRGSRVAQPITEVRAFLVWLRARSGDWGKVLRANAEPVTVNRQLAESAIVANDKMEIVMVPKRVGKRLTLFLHSVSHQ